MTLPACPNGKCRCWCGLLQNLDCGIPSRIAELAACNDAPSDSDKQLCQSTLHDLPEDLQTLDNHIECLESTLSALKTVRKTKFSQAHSCRSILNPIRSLPTEILSKIFCDASPSVDFVDLLHEFEEYSSLNEHRAPWTLARVSARWRQTALSTPRMWSRIGITQKHWYSSRNRLRVQIGLSKSSPLIVAIDWRLFALPKDMVKTLFPSSPRWQTLVLSPELDYHLGILEGKLPSLRNLLYAQSEAQCQTISTFANAPELRTLYVPRLDYLRVLDRLPLSQITVFSTSYSRTFTPSDLFGLARLTALQQCILTFGYFKDGTDGAAIPFILPNLRILRLKADSVNAANILKRLTLPALEVLCIEEIKLGKPALAPFVQRSQCVLKELHLESRMSKPVSMSTVEDITIAFEKSALERLTLDHEFVAVLASRIDLLPSLKVLITLIGGGQQPDLYLLQFLKDAHPELVVTCKSKDFTDY